MYRRKGKTPNPKISDSSSHPLSRQESALKKHLRKTLLPGMGRPAREWIRACLDTLQDIAKTTKRSALPAMRMAA